MNNSLATERLEAIILGGGRGTRLNPLTRMRAKPAVQIGGKYRLIDIPMSNCIHSGIRNIHILTQFNTASLHRHIFRTYNFDMFARGNVSLLAAQQTFDNIDWFQGTADAVRAYWGDLKRRPASYFVILAGDHLYKMNYQYFLNHMVDHQADIAIAAKTVPVEEASEFGIMAVDDQGFVTDFMEKPSPEFLRSEEGQKWQSNGSVLISMGIYLFKKDVLTAALKFTGNDFGREILPAAIRQFPTAVYPFHGYWEDIGTIRSFFNANLNLTEKDPVFKFYDQEFPIFTRPRFLPGSRIQDTRIESSFINDGCIVGQSTLKRCILGIRSVVGNDVTMENVYHMGADYYDQGSEEQTVGLGIGDGSVLKNVILDKNVRIGVNVQLINHEGILEKDGSWYFIRDGIIVIPKGTVIPANTTL
ncbi:MAG: sugar phosphate nucleotidyltransferase [Fidelibacterota bacterium]